MRVEGASQCAKKNKGTKRKRKKEGRGEWKAPFWLAVTHIHLPSFSGAHSLLATGSLCERIPAFSQRQSPCEGREGRMAEREREGGRYGRVDTRPLLLLFPKACCSWRPALNGFLQIQKAEHTQIAEEEFRLFTQSSNTSIFSKSTAVLCYSGNYMWYIIILYY